MLWFYMQSTKCRRFLACLLPAIKSSIYEGAERDPGCSTTRLGVRALVSRPARSATPRPARVGSSTTPARVGSSSLRWKPSSATLSTSTDHGARSSSSAICELATVRMKLQPGICQFLVLRVWVKIPCHTPVAWRFIGMSRPLPVSRLPSEDQQITDCSSSF